jgi:protein RecA
VSKKKKTVDFYEMLDDNFAEFLVKPEEDTTKITGIIPTGITSLDVSLGIGGIPLGRFVELYGVEMAGKAQPLDCQILTPVGWKNLGEIKVGDLVSTPDGKYAPIVGIYPQGKMDVFEVEFSDGTLTRCSKEHLWMVQTWEDRQDSSYRILSLSDMLSDYKLSDRLKYSIPINLPIEFSIDNEPLIDPYILGLLLGDGSTVDSTIHFSTSDGEIVQALSDYANKTDQSITQRSKYDFSIKKKKRIPWEKSKIRRDIEQLGLGNKKSYEKFIPNSYKFALVRDRIALLQGLMDTDGTVKNSESGGGLSFCTTSYALAVDFIHIVRSLGGRATVYNKQSRYSYQGNINKGRLAYIVNIILPDYIIPFRLQRKLSKYKIRTNNTLTKYISNINHIGKDIVECIFIDHPDHLYITDDFIVTHNTTLSLNLSRSALDLDYNVLYVDAEQGVDIDFARSILGDLVDKKERFTLIQPRTMEQALGICEEGVRSKKFNLVVLDSIGSLAPLKVFEDDLDDSNVALLSRRMTTFLQRNSFEVRNNNVAFVGTNQVRDKIGAYIPTLETPGGHAWKHICSLRIMLTRMGGKEGLITQGEDTIGVQTKFVIKKSKVSAPFRAFYFPIMFEGGIDKVRDLVEFASTMGILVGSYYSFEGKTLGNGFNNTVEALRKDQITLDKIQKMCYNSINSGKLIVESEKETTDEQVFEA